MSAPPFVLTLICGEPRLAAAACEAGIDRVMVDLERLGKAERQAGRPLFISGHSWEDAIAVRAVVPAGRFFMRLDPWHDGSAGQIERAIDLGADGLMIPYFREPDPVLRFTERVAGRALVTPLVETAGAVATLPNLLETGAISEFHIGLNDLALDVGYPSLHSLWGDPLLDAASQTARAAGVAFGIGGVTDPRITGLPVDPLGVIAEHRRLGSSRALLGRSFSGPFQHQPDSAQMAKAVTAIRSAYGAVTSSADHPGRRVTPQSTFRSV